MAGFNPGWRFEDVGRFCRLDIPDGGNPAAAAPPDAEDTARCGGSWGSGPATLVRAAGLSVHRFPLAGYDTTMSWSSSIPTTWPGKRGKIKTFKVVLTSSFTCLAQALVHPVRPPAVSVLKMLDDLQIEVNVDLKQ